MLRKALLTLLTVMMLPTLASAYNCWSIVRSASPSTAATSITPTVVPGVVVSGNTIYVQAATSAACATAPSSVTFTVGVPAGLSTTSVKVDSVAKPLIPATYTVDKGFLINHRIAATYSTINYLVSTSIASGGGTISPSANVASGASAVIAVNPFSGYALTSLTDNATDVTSSVIAGQYTLTNVTAGHTLVATFTQQASANAVIYGATQTTTVNASATIDASGSTAAGFTPTYAWSVSPTTGTTLTPSGKTATLACSATGDYTVTFKIMNGATEVSSATQTVSVQIAQSGCNSCHYGTGTPPNGISPAVVTDFEASTHYQATITCSSCHNPEGTLSHHYDPNPAMVCTNCHNAGSPAKFVDSKHWNSNLEYGPEFAGGAVPGQLNANESWTTTENGTLVTCAYRCHFKPGMGPDPSRVSTGGITYSDATGTYNRPTGDGCTACHEPHKLGLPTFKGTCLTCHSGSKHGKVPAEFFASKHWNNHLEYGSEFAGGAVPGELDANNSYTTTENGSLVTCAYRCHFKPGMGPDPTKRSTGGIAYTDPQTAQVYNRPTGDACLACHDAHGLEANYNNTCLTCHSGSKHGKVPAEFFASAHWQNHLETGPEFANQPNTTVVGGSVVTNGTIDGVMNANDAYTTTENGGATTCAYRCHFRPGMYPAGVTPPAAYINPINKKAITYVMYSSPYGAGKFTRPGGDACMACHNAHGLEATARSTCYTCHAGGNHGWSVKAFEKSSHFTGTYATLDGIGGPTGEACTACHNAHSLEAAFFTMSGSTGLVKLGAGCQKCHAPGSPYGVYDATGAGTGNHFVGLAAPVNVKTVKTAYVGPRSTCADCHSHNNSINADWAEGGHGNLDSLAFDGSAAENFKTMGVAGVSYQADPSQRNCVRCHTAAGFAQFVDSGFTNIAPVGLATDNTSEPIVCSACHNNVDKGTLRLANFTSQHNGGGYTARYGYKNAIANNVLVNTAIYLGNNKNSNVCMPCHSQRASGQEIKDVFAVGAFKQYSAGSAIYPHAAQPAAIVAGKGAYEFTTFTAPADGHSKIGNSGYNGTGSTQGSCVGCHMNFTGKTHSLEISFTGSCQKCHPASFDQAAVDAAKADFDAAVALLGNLLVEKGVTLDGINPLPERKAKDLSGGTKSNTALDANGLNAEQKMGAWFNWYLFTTADAGAFAHNPSYAKQVVKDSIDVLAHGTVTGSISDVPGASALAALTTHPTASNTSNTCNVCHISSSAEINGCVNCHDIAQNDTANADINNDGVRALAGEFTKRSHHITGAAPTDAQCKVCHLEGGTAAHMNGQVDLRNADTDAAFVWTGSEHTAMDNFCFSCHDDNGAVSATSGAIHTILPAATASNPFADTLTNGYDLVARAGVVDVKSAFATTNASHHAVSGPRYAYRFSTRANADAWSIRNGGAAGDVPDSQIAEGKVVGGEVVEFGTETMPADYMNGTSEAEATLFETGKFVATYKPLGDTEFVGDNSQLHCGDCHTVGQWKANATTNADGTNAAAAIGAHGSANEYMLRNSKGTDALHNPLTLICFNCHKNTVTTSPASNFNQIKGYATAHAVSAFHGQCIADSALQTGTTNRLQLSERPDREATWAVTPGTTSTNAGSGNITGIGCTSCHNSGLRQGWGGIHGGNNTYTDGLGRSQQTYRFMPGMGNYRYAPPGGWDGKDVSDPTLVTQAGAGVGAGKPMGGCYTNSALTGSDPNTGFGACSHHGTSTATNGGYRDGKPGFRQTYGGGTTGTPTAVEPTVREATGGTSLVTRPVKY